MIWDKLHTGLFSAGIIAAGLYLYEWHNHAIDLAKFESTKSAQDTLVATQQKVLADAKADMEAHRKEDLARDAATAAKLASLDASYKSALQSAQSQTAWLQSQLKTIIPGLSITTDKSGNTTAQIPTKDLPDAMRAVEDCKECQIKLQKSLTDVQSREAQMADAQKQIDALKTENSAIYKERDAAIKVAKGGSIFKRVGKAAKYVIIGVALGVVAGKKL